MRAAAFAAALTSLAAGLPAAGEISLQPPIDCDLGTDCYIQQYVDHDPSRGASDYRCAPLSYDNHTGTDFALRSLSQMRAGVNVIASAPGTVRATRDGMQDRFYTRKIAQSLDGRDCGNGVVITHADGWTTQYCHLKQGSVAVRKGEAVKAGTVLGQVGLSGRTQFPHVHLTLRKDGNMVDPFDPDGQISCRTPSDDTLWARALPYRPGGILTVGFADRVPEFDDIKAGEAARATLPTEAPAIVVFGHAFGSQAGDIMDMRIDGPGGTLITERVALTKTQAELFRAIGKRLTTTGWPTGTYRGTVSLIRNGKVINTERSTVQVR